MNMRTIIEQNPVLAILRNVPMDIVEPYVESILRGGVRFFEVALNSSDALQQIRFLKDRFGDEILLGAGTAITVELAQQAVEAGARAVGQPPLFQQQGGHAAHAQVAQNADTCRTTANDDHCGFFHAVLRSQERQL